MKKVLLIGDSIRFGASANPEYDTAYSPGYGVYVEGENREAVEKLLLENGVSVDGNGGAL